MARARPKPSLSPRRLVAAHGSHVSQAATHLSQLLTSRAFSVEGDHPLLTRVRANLDESGAEVSPAAAAWIGMGAAPADCAALSLADGQGALGPHSFGFLSNVTGIAALAVPIPERPRLGVVGFVVGRRESLPPFLPLLCARDLGAAWVISVGDGDPAEAVRFLGKDPATRAICVSAGRGLRAQALLDVSPDKPLVLLAPPAATEKDRLLLRAVLRQQSGIFTQDLEEWLAHAALWELPPRSPSPTKRSKRTSQRLHAAVVVLDGGQDYLSAELLRAGVAADLTVSVHGVALDDSGVLTRHRLETALAQVQHKTDLLVLAAPAEVMLPHALPQPLVRVESGHPDRLRSLLRAFIQQAQRTLPSDDKAAEVVVDHTRIDGVMQGLPPPLYVRGAMVEEELLSDQDLKRLLSAFGVRVSRQALVSSPTAALRICAKLVPPLDLLPMVEPQRDVAVLDAHEQSSRVTCATPVEVKRQATQLLVSASSLVMRERLAPGQRLRIFSAIERGVGKVLHLALWPPGPGADKAVLCLPLGPHAARRAAGEVVAAEQVPLVADLLCRLAACISEQSISVDLLAQVSAADVIITQAAGVLRRSR